MLYGESQRFCLNDVQGAFEKRTEPYLSTVMGVSQNVTQQIVKRQYSAASSAREQVMPSGVLR